MILEMKGMGISYWLANSTLFAHEDEISILWTRDKTRGLRNSQIMIDDSNKRDHNRFLKPNNRLFWRY